MRDRATDRGADRGTVLLGRTTNLTGRATSHATSNNLDYRALVPFWNSGISWIYIICTQWCSNYIISWTDHVLIVVLKAKLLTDHFDSVSC